MTTPTTKDKLFALAAATGKMMKEGKLSEAMKNLDLIAHCTDDASLSDAADIIDKLQELEPNGPPGYKEKQAIDTFKVDLDLDGDEPRIDIDLSRFTHDQALFILVTILGGAMREITETKDDGDRKRAAISINNTLNMIARWVTKEDWDKAQAMIKNQKPPEDTFTDWLSA